MKVIVNNVTFDGITGPIGFSAGAGGYDNFGRGDRDCGILFDVLNFHSEVYTQSSGGNHGLVSIGRWSSESGLGVCVGTNYKCASIEYNTVDNSKPPDSPASIAQRMSYLFKIIILVTASLCLFVVFVFSVFTLTNIKSGVIRAGQPIMLLVVLLGAAVGGSRIINSSFDVTDNTCVAGTFLGHLTFVLVFNTLLVKTWRVHRLVNSRMKKIRVSSSHILSVTLVGVVVALIYLTVMVVVSPPHKTTVTVVTLTETLLYFTCSQSMPIFTTLLFVGECLCLLMGVRLCWATRNVPDAINESKYIAICER